MFDAFTHWQLLAIALIFVWSGFVRSGLGFGGAALALPLMLMVLNQPVFWLPIVASHLLFFSILTLIGKLSKVDWHYLGKALLILMIPKLVGVIGLLNLPNALLVNMVYGITLLYGFTYVAQYSFKSSGRLVDYLLLFLGGYASGTSLIGAPLISAVFARHVRIEQLRETLFVLWIIMVTIKMSAFVVLDVPLNFAWTLVLLPCAGLGHFLGLKLHKRLIASGTSRFQYILGCLLIVISGYGLLRNLL